MKTGRPGRIDNDRVPPGDLGEAESVETAAARGLARMEGEVLAKNPAEYSGSLTAVLMPEGHDAESARRGGIEEAHDPLAGQELAARHMAFAALFVSA